ncbi:MAG: hypothetical protein PHP61_02890 [Candidatus Izemoplasmatales bacterium]|jgi:hypothetical protein|nr:hypothetical protein [Candidatus Izemoplasmatales bacterium]MDD4354831.1 hypothetical protein [Candidatus Izemoplasmatales bacterium]MDY0373905.1 hypothetical protein [Candidatus Izemoplasmatales bacterium]
MSFKQWFSIKKDQNARGLLLGGIVLFNVLLWIIASIISYLAYPDIYDGLPNALWSSALAWMLDPGNFDPNLPILIRILSVMVIIVSMITFTGGIIGYVASLFSAFIDSARQGKGKLLIKDHVLILNWNFKALELIADYIYSELTTVVVLSDKDKGEVEAAIKRKLFDAHITKKAMRKINVIVRTGQVFSRADLDNVSIECARTVIILANEEEINKSGSVIDTLSMKTLMLATHMNIPKDQTIIIEVVAPETIQLINEHISPNVGMHDRIIAIYPDELMGSIIGQTILMPDLNSVYRELLSFEGAEFYTIPACDPLEYLMEHNYAVPIYPMSGLLYLLASCPEDIGKTRNEPLTIDKTVKLRRAIHAKDRSIVIFGKNRKLPFIIASLKRYQEEEKTHITITMVDSNEPEVIAKSIQNLDHIDTILILSNDQMDASECDSDVLVTLLMIQDIAKQHDAEIVIELLDPRHYDIAQGYNIRNTIISNEYISLFISQLSKNRRLFDLIIDLLTYDEVGSDQETYELYTYQADEIFAEKFPIHFASASEMIISCRKESAGEVIVIGVIIDGKKRLFKGNLDQGEPISLNAEDIVIAITK